MAGETFYVARAVNNCGNRVCPLCRKRDIDICGFPVCAYVYTCACARVYVWNTAYHTETTMFGEERQPMFEIVVFHGNVPDRDERHRWKFAVRESLSRLIISNFTLVRRTEISGIIANVTRGCDIPRREGKLNRARARNFH